MRGIFLCSHHCFEVVEQLPMLAEWQQVVLFVLTAAKQSSPLTFVFYNSTACDLWEVSYLSLSIFKLGSEQEVKLIFHA
jgi:hypothetical protein